MTQRCGCADGRACAWVAGSKRCVTALNSVLSRPVLLKSSQGGSLTRLHDAVAAG